MRVRITELIAWREKGEWQGPIIDGIRRGVEKLDGELVRIEVCGDIKRFGICFEVRNLPVLGDTAICLSDAEIEMVMRGAMESVDEVMYEGLVLVEKEIERIVHGVGALNLVDKIVGYIDIDADFVVKYSGFFTGAIGRLMRMVLREIVEKLPSRVDEKIVNKCRYFVAKYDSRVVKSEIEAAIKCLEGGVYT